MTFVNKSDEYQQHLHSWLKHASVNNACVKVSLNKGICLNPKIDINFVYNIRIIKRKFLGVTLINKRDKIMIVYN